MVCVFGSVAGGGNAAILRRAFNHFLGYTTCSTLDDGISAQLSVMASHYVWCGLCCVRRDAAGGNAA